VTPRQNRVVEALRTTPVVQALTRTHRLPASGSVSPATTDPPTRPWSPPTSRPSMGASSWWWWSTRRPRPGPRRTWSPSWARARSFLFPQGEARFYGEETDPRIGGLRVEAVEALFSGSARVFVTTPRALQERVALPDRLTRLRLELEEGDEIGFQLLVEELETMGYERVPLVEEVGQFAVRGGLIDVFSLGSSDPVRLEFWGDEITSIRRFQVADQRSTGPPPPGPSPPGRLPLHRGAGGPSRTERRARTGFRSFLEVLPDDAILVNLCDHRLARDVPAQLGPGHEDPPRPRGRGRAAPRPRGPPPRAGGEWRSPRSSAIPCSNSSPTDPATSTWERVPRRSSSGA
jgi:hypothetical protein